MIRAMFFDLDGTLLSRNGTVSIQNRKALERAREKGILTGIATGRELSSVQALMEKWQIDGLIDLIVGTGGSEVCDLRTGYIEQDHFLDGELIREVITHFEDMDCGFVVPLHGKLYAPKDDRFIRELSAADELPYEIVDFDTFLTSPKPKLMLVTDPEKMDQIVERAGTFRNDRYKAASLITASILYEYMDPNVTKAGGIAKILEPFGITLEETAAFGDADNDEHMLKSVGFGIAMGNGSEKTKAAADLITVDSEENGVAQGIDYVLDIVNQ